MSGLTPVMGNNLIASFDCEICCLNDQLTCDTASYRYSDLCRVLQLGLPLQEVGYMSLRGHRFGLLLANKRGWTPTEIFAFIQAKNIKTFSLADCWDNDEVREADQINYSIEGDSLARL